MATSGGSTVWRQRAVEVDLPRWLLNGDPTELEHFAAWSATLIDASRHRWAIQTRESVDGVPANLLRLHLIANGRFPDSPAYDRLSALPENQTPNADEFRRIALKRDEDIGRTSGSDVVAAMYRIRLRLVSAKGATEVAATLRALMVQTILPAMPTASVYLLEVDAVVPRRVGMARALLRKDEPTQVVTAVPGSSFRAGQGLFMDAYLGLSAYLEPLLTSLSPWVWGITAGRIGGVIVLLFGEPVLGLGEIPRDMLDLSLPRNTPAPTAPIAKPSQSAFAAALNWWVSQLDRVLSVASNPANHLRGGRYDPQRGVESLLSLEQFFRHAQSLAVHPRDQHAQRMLLFAALDTLPGINPSWNWTQTTNLDRCQAIFDDLEHSIPPAAAPALLPRARKAVGALLKLQDGFFVPSQISNGSVLLANKTGTLEHVPLATATSQWLRVLRNSHHGFDNEQKPRERALLAAHNGEVPTGLPDLLWLHLLRLMAHPEQLIRRQ